MIVCIGGPSDGKRITSSWPLEQIEVKVMKRNPSGWGPPHETGETKIYEKRIIDCDSGHHIVYALKGMSGVEILEHLISKYPERVNV